LNIEDLYRAVLYRSFPMANGNGDGDGDDALDAIA
jgi:hypothetical protein